MMANLSKQAAELIVKLEDLAVLVDAEDALGRQAGFDVRRARSAIVEVARAVRQAQLAAVLEDGDMVELKRRGQGTFFGFINSHPGKALVEQYGRRGWYDVDEINLVCIEELGRQVASLERHVAEWADRPGRDKSAPERLAGYQRQLARLHAKAA